METQSDTQNRLFASPTEHFIAQVRWAPGEGWRVWVSSWDLGENPARAHSSTYTMLTADEALDVLAAEQMSRCDWLRD